jgi:hypothetical protein
MSRRRVVCVSVVLMGVVGGCSSNKDPLPIFDSAVDDATQPDTGFTFDSTRDDATDTGSDATTDSTVTSDSTADVVVDAPLDSSVDSTVVDAPIDTTPRDTSVEPDTGPEVDAFTDGSDLDGGSADASDALPDASPALVPVGQLCSLDTDCDPTGALTGVCSNHLTGLGTIDPTPVCATRKCDIGTGPTRCGLANAGVCVPGGPAHQCRAACTFGTSDGLAPTGCKGKDACTSFAVETDSTGSHGIGYCGTGCVANADCTGGDVCEAADGNCVKTLAGYTKVTGDVCTDSSACPCIINATAGSGFCTHFCKVGDATATCPSGFTCDPHLDPTRFTKVPIGLAGLCYKNCSSDADCTSLSGYCDTTSVTGVKVCLGGPKP